jgi:hypothetical protein
MIAPMQIMRAPRVVTKYFRLSKGLISPSSARYLSKSLSCRPYELQTSMIDLDVQLGNVLRHLEERLCLRLR